MERRFAIMPDIQSGNVMKNSGIRPSLYSFLVLMGALLLILAGWQVMKHHLVLEVRDLKGGGRLLSLAVEKGEHFLLRYTHSTAKTPVEEHFQVLGHNHILFTRMVYASGGAGIPDLPPPGASFRIDPGGRFVMEGLNRHFQSLANIRVAYFYPFLLEIAGERYNLWEIARGRLVEIRVRPRILASLESLWGGR
jgi:hypothetical protein